LKNPSIKRILPYVTVGFSLLATVTIFFPALRYDDLVFNGIDIAFGTQISDFDPFGFGSIASARHPVSTYALAAYFAPLIAGVVTMVFKTGNVFSLAMYVLAAVLFFMLADHIEIIITLAGNETSEAVEWHMAYGIVIAGVLSIFAALSEMLHISISEH
jgi:hypothetical protein